MNNYHTNKLLRILDGNMEDDNLYEFGEPEDWQPTTDPIPEKWGLRDMITEIYNALPQVYKETLHSIELRESNRLSFYWSDLYNEDKQYLRVSDILFIMNQYVNIVTFDMDADGYADMNIMENGTTDERISLIFIFEIEPHEFDDSTLRTRSMQKKLQKMKRQMRRR